MPVIGVSASRCVPSMPSAFLGKPGVSSRRGSAAGWRARTSGSAWHMFCAISALPRVSRSSALSVWLRSDRGRRLARRGQRQRARSSAGGRRVMAAKRLIAGRLDALVAVQEEPASVGVEVVALDGRRRHRENRRAWGRGRSVCRPRSSRASPTSRQRPPSRESPRRSRGVPTRAGSSSSTRPDSRLCSSYQTSAPASRRAVTMAAAEGVILVAVADEDAQLFGHKMPLLRYARVGS